MELAVFPGFKLEKIGTEEGAIFIQRGGNGAPVLLLHGFPQTHAMWRDIAPLLAADFSVICADLRGYGRSDCPRSDEQHLPYSKRAMAAEMVEVMAALGYDRFAVAGHDRGGRVAYRAALDHPDVVTRLAVLDVIPTGALWDRADARLMTNFWPFSFLAQPAPLPEALLGSCPEAVVDDALNNWGSPPETFPASAREAYIEALRDPARVHTICEEYRAAASTDREHDDVDRRAGRRIRCPLLALWSEKGGLNSWYVDEGGPLAIWRTLADDVCGGPVPGGHFFPEEHPTDIAGELKAFLGPAV